jgi:hypothetical protein
MPISYPVRLFLAAGLLLAGGGCASHRPTDQLAQAVNTGERPVAMKGEAAFFNKRLAVTVTISQGIGRGKAGLDGRHKESRPTALDVNGMDRDDAIAYLRAKNAVGSPMPPVTLHLRIQNLSTQTYQIDVADFESDLGNFAVFPEVLAVAPSQIAEPEPMISQLGVTADTIPVKVTLRMNGQVESQTVMVRNLLGGPGSGPN